MAAALLVARTLDPSVDEDAVRTTLAELGGRFATRVSQEGAAQSLAEFLRDEGFKASDNLQNLDASRIDKVLSSRRGIPITLSIPYLMVGRASGMTTQGINFPGHFLLSADGVLIDPLTGDLLTQRRRRAMADGCEPDPSRAECAGAGVAGRNGGAHVQQREGDLRGARRLRRCAGVDRQPDAAGRDTGPLHMERAELWFRLGDAAAAASVLEEARGTLAGTRWEAEIDKRLKRLAGQPRSTIH